MKDDDLAKELKKNFTAEKLTGPEFMFFFADIFVSYV